MEIFFSYEMGDNKVSWVKDRYECTVENIFQKLVDRIDQDVKEFNEHSESRKKSAEFKTNLKDKNFYVCPETDFPKPDYIRIRLNSGNKRMEFYENQDRLFCIEVEWHGDKLDCKLKATDNEGVKNFMTLAEISQRTIGDFMFGYTSHW